MSDPQTLGPWLRRFLTEYIVTERNLACQRSFKIPPPAVIENSPTPG